MASSSRPLPLALTTLLLCLVASAWGTSRLDEPAMMEKFHRWKEQHGKSYPTATEKLHRFEVYRRNVEHIEVTNREGRLSYTLGENHFADLTSEEFIATYTGRHAMPPEMRSDEEGEDDAEIVITTRVGDVAEGHGAAHGANLSVVVPESVDWRAKGAVTPVKNQGTCGSCYAFAVVASVESLHQIKTGELVSLSEQQLVDCGTYGCNTGTSTSAFTWIRKNGGITTEDDYPYVAKKGVCDASKLKKHAATIRGDRVLRYNEQKLLEAVVEQPVTVAIHVEANFQLYQGGVYSGPCDFPTNHIVTIVGYGKDATTGKKYWIVKNSYGQSWGMGGYILMERGLADPRGLCNINFYPVWPTM
ncbi:unnamed protein product [Alopecurus aequalis]